MSAHLERARLLLAQSRPADAEVEAMQALTADPTQPFALALLALSRSEQGKHEAALEAAAEAVGLAPDEPYFHYVHAAIHHRMERHEDAFRSVQESLRLDPHDADAFSLLASIELGRRRWDEALEAAERALAIDAEHVNAVNLRAMALVRLGRKQEAVATVDFALHRAPEDAFSHANQGWNCLHQNDARKAKEHFREALRIEPGLEYAREGMVEALKARNPIYRVLLAYFLWLGRQSGRFQWGFIIGIYFGTRAIWRLAADQPERTWLWWSLLGVLYAFVYLSWTAHPMFNLLLRLDRFGRHVLTDEERRATNWFGGAVALVLVALAAWLVTRHPAGLDATIITVCLSICIAASVGKSGRKSTMMATATAVLAIVGAAALALEVNQSPAAGGLTALFLVGFIGFQIMANVLAMK